MMIMILIMTTDLWNTMLSPILTRAKKASASSWVSKTKLSHTILVIRPPRRDIFDSSAGRRGPIICHTNTRSICCRQVSALLSTISRSKKPKVDTSWTSWQGHAILTWSGPAEVLLEGNLSQIMSRSCSRWYSDLSNTWRISIIGSKAFSAVANPCSKGCCRILDCYGQVRFINLDQLSPLCRTSLTRELVLARARIDTGSRKEIMISTSSEDLQNIFSASMPLRDFLCINPCNSNFALPHNAKHLPNILFGEDLSWNLNFLSWKLEPMNSWFWS